MKYDSPNPKMQPEKTENPKNNLVQNGRKNTSFFGKPQKTVTKQTSNVDFLTAISINFDKLDQEKMKLNLRKMLNWSRFDENEFESLFKFCRRFNRRFLEKKALEEFGKIFLELGDLECFFSEALVSKIMIRQLVSGNKTQFEKMGKLVEILGFFLTVSDKLQDLVPCQYSGLPFVKVLKSQMNPIMSIVEFPLDEEADAQTVEKLRKFQRRLEKAGLKGRVFLKSPVRQKSSSKMYTPPDLLKMRPNYVAFELTAGDISNMSIFPKKKDLCQDQEIALNKLETSKNFRNHREYLETHFRLLREDFTQALREGFLQYKLEEGTKSKNMNLSIFTGVSVAE